MDTRNINVQVLAIIGDSVLSLYVRECLVLADIKDANTIQKKSIEYLSAKSETKILTEMINNNVLTEKELETVKRGRNNKKNKHPKNTDIITYKLSTGFEALLGELYLNNRERLNEILSLIEVKK